MAVTPVAAEAGVHTALPRMTTIRLVAGRGAFRIAGQLMAVVLALLWGADTYARFANAVGVCGWLAFVPIAAEKAALKLLPRSGTLAPDVARLAVRTAVVPSSVAAAVLLAAATATAATGWPGATVVLYLGTATWSVATGALMTFSGLHRLQGRPGLDARAFGIVGAVIAVATAVTALAHLRPERHALLLAAGVVPVVAASLLALPPAWRRGRTRRWLPVFGRSMVLLGLPDLVDAVALAILFGLLAASGRIGESRPFYLVLMPFGVLCSVVLYLLRLRQPATSQRLRGTGADAGRAEALRLLRLVERVAAPLTLVAGPAALAAVTGATLGTVQLYAVLAVLGLLETGCYLAVLYASYLLENTTSAVLVRTGNAALLRLAVAVVVGALLVPWSGAAGAYLALAVSLVVQAGLLRRLVLRLPPAAGRADLPPTDDHRSDLS